MKKIKVENFKLKTEEKTYVDAAKDIFFSFDKKDIYDRYQKSGDSFDKTYALVTYDMDLILENNINFIDNKSVLMVEFFIKETERGTGLSKYFMDKIIHKLKEKDIKEVFLYASEEWKGTPFNILKRFYESFGFKQTKENSKIFKIAF